MSKGWRNSGVSSPLAQGEFDSTNSSGRRFSSPIAQLLQQGFDLSVLEVDDLLLPLVHKAADSGQQNVHGWRTEDMFGAKNRPVSGVDG